MLIPFMNDGGIELTVANMRRKGGKLSMVSMITFRFIILSYHDITFKSPFFACIMCSFFSTSCKKISGLFLLSLPLTVVIQKCALNLPLSLSTLSVS